jgi:hypothetical protein
MIRINLIGKSKRSEKKAFSFNFSAGDNVKIIGLAVAPVIIAIIVGMSFFNVKDKLAAKEIEVADSIVELADLQAVKARVEAKKLVAARVERRLEILSELKKIRTPLEEISIIYAMQLNHTGVAIGKISHTSDQEIGDSVVIDGEATQEELNTFSGDLEDLNFVRIVDIVSQVDQAFQIRVYFQQIYKFGAVADGEQELASDEGGNN